MARAPASCSWWLWDGIQDRTLWKTLPFPPSNSFCMDSSAQMKEDSLQLLPATLTHRYAAIHFFRLIRY